MKFIIFTELLDEENLLKVFNIEAQREKERERNPNQFFKILFPFHAMNSEEGFLIVETDDEDHLMRYLADYGFALSARVTPIFNMKKVANYIMRKKN